MAHTSQFGSSQFGSSQFSGLTPEIVNEAIKASDLMPKDAYLAIKDFISETFKETWKTADELINMSPPTELADYWSIVIDIIKSLSQ